MSELTPDNTLVKLTEERAREMDPDTLRAAWNVFVHFRDWQAGKEKVLSLAKAFVHAHFEHVEGYSEVRLLPNGDWAGLKRQIRNVGLFTKLDVNGWGHVYQYVTFDQASIALQMWDGEGDPPGPWVKHKGLGGERPGPGAKYN